MKLFFLLFIASLQCVAQDTVKTSVKKQRHRFPIWTYHQKNVTTHGVSLGLGSFADGTNSANTNGVKIELIGAGIVMPFIPQSFVPTNDNDFSKDIKDTLSEKINGIVISASGTVCDCRTNGLVLGAIFHYNTKVNGASISLAMNEALINNGLQFGMFTNCYKMNGLQIGGKNHSYYTNGVQIGLYNISKHLRGFQFGLWNVNEKRSLPVVNWYFGKGKKVKS
ncbi:MAG: hypothetical protein ABL940_03630 [Bacteroidia bacterium]